MGSREEVRRLLERGLKQVEIACHLGFSPGRISQLVKEIRVGGGSAGEGDRKRETNGGKTTRRPPPGPNRGSFKPGNPGGPGAPRGNDNATKTGQYRNPLLHGVRPDCLAIVTGAAELSPADQLRMSIQLHMLAIADMTREIEAIQASTKRWWWMESVYRRQEGDGELMGTGRISERSRVPRQEALARMIEARARLQAKLDQAIIKLYEMLQDQPPDEDDPLLLLVEVLRESRKAAATDLTASTANVDSGCDCHGFDRCKLSCSPAGLHRAEGVPGRVPDFS